jgi:hypothetical protein
VAVAAVAVTTALLGLPASAAARSGNPGVVIEIQGGYSNTGSSTGSAPGDALSSYSDVFTFHVVLGRTAVSQQLHLSDLRAALRHKRGQLTHSMQWLAGKGTEAVTTQSGTTCKRRLARERPEVFYARYRNRRDLAASLGWGEFYKGMPQTGPCGFFAPYPVAVSFGNNPPVMTPGSWSWSGMPRIDFPNVPDAVSGYGVGPVFKVNVKHPAGVHHLSYIYSYTPMDPGWTPGAFQYRLTWHATVTIKFVG